MNIPAGFRKWRCHWFECPSCRHRDYRTWANVAFAQRPARVLWRFWCERCGAYATLSRQMMPTIAAAVMLFIVGPLAGVLVALASRAGWTFESLVLVFAACWVLQPLVFLALTRWTYRYLPAPP